MPAVPLSPPVGVAAITVGVSVWRLRAISAVMARVTAMAIAGTIILTDVRPMRRRGARGVRAPVLP